MHGLLPLDVVYLIWNALICLTGEIWTTLRTLLIMNCYCSQNHSLGKVKGTKVTEAFDLSDAYYMLLAPCGPIWRWWVVRTAISRCVFWRETPRGIEPEGIVGLADLHMGISRIPSP